MKRKKHLYLFVATCTCFMENQSFEITRFHYTVDLYHARQSLVSDIEQEFGEFGRLSKIQVSQMHGFAKEI